MNFCEQKGWQENRMGSGLGEEKRRMNFNGIRTARLAVIGYNGASKPQMEVKPQARQA